MDILYVFIILTILFLFFIRKNIIQYLYDNDIIEEKKVITEDDPIDRIRERYNKNHEKIYH